MSEEIESTISAVEPEIKSEAVSVAETKSEVVVDPNKSLDGSIVFGIKHKRCALKLQCMMRQHLAYKKFLNVANEMIEKIKDPVTSKECGVEIFYYYHKVLKTSRWDKPSFIGSHDIEKIAPTYTTEQAAIMVQHVWRKRMVINTHTNVNHFDMSQRWLVISLFICFLLIYLIICSKCMLI
jgi:hypothetical protein